jgi:hypothetical protein
MQDVTGKFCQDESHVLSSFIRNSNFRGSIGVLVRKDGPMGKEVSGCLFHRVVKNELPRAGVQDGKKNGRI